MKINWQGCYNLLIQMKFSDKDIADLVGITRVTVNRVRNHSDYAEQHDPRFSGGMHVLKTLRSAQKRGELSTEDLKAVGLK